MAHSQTWDELTRLNQFKRGGRVHAPGSSGEIR
jgi:hypothetical protein